MDYQRQRVYDAENEWTRLLNAARDLDCIEVYGSRLAVPIERRFGSLDTVREYVQRILRLPEVIEVYGHREVEVVLGRKDLRKRAYARGAVITLPQDHREGRWAWRESVVLHELAHTLTSGDRHGPRFAAALLHLFDLVISPEAAWLLRVLYSEHNVNHYHLEVSA